ncbi:NAD-dependent epimerase/dehydratase family protein [Stratiformator vulcanicus]|uniref:3 beta-hydroxysteroid dehydrogenase/Delta 5-->4-isomerase n=1 Tax=Stratiformator vulcanicus TaxID=2527980 RepID=A0A517R1U8_9PLAN|nr:NAD-dependent epimerase/dehydratase family protein [Stratiformator vulcanicus]QDT37856.1 3 beta-hydroxysteroid dehydrogenase/Delta 5-->4-isomerase [Stratiformator vulcanicus]
MSGLSLVTGGGGFLGRYIVEQLVAKGLPVRVFCRGDYDFLDELGVETFRGDLTDENAIRAACEGCETVFHVAALPGVWGPRSVYEATNLTGTEHVIEGCRSAGVRKLIFTSSPSVVFDGAEHVDANEEVRYPAQYLCHYPATKAAAERAVLKANDPPNLVTAALRPHLIWGPRDPHLLPRLIERAKSGRLRRVGSGENVVSVAYVENAAAAHLQLADTLEESSPAAGHAYFINDPDSVLLWDWVNELLAIANLPPIRRSISAKAAYGVGAMLEGAWSALRLSGEPPMTRFVAQQLSRSHSYSIEGARRDFGYQPLVDHKEAMRRTTPYLKQLGSR